MPLNQVPEAGSIITGTHNPADLGPAFHEALRHYDFHAWLCLPPIPKEEGDAFWHTEAGTLLLDTLTYALEAAAPEGLRFGAHPGDGSDIGYWPDEEEDDA